MNCRAAHVLLSAERDHALAAGDRAQLDQHLAACPACRQARHAVESAVSSWRSTVAAAVPDSQRAWQDIRREIRAPAERRIAPAWWAVPAGIAAAAALVVSLNLPLMQRHRSMLAHEEVARAEYVDVPAASSSMVYVDDQSGWLVVWAVENPR